MLFINHNEKNREEWIKKERKIKNTFYLILLICIFFISIIICDVLFFHSVFVSMFSVLGSIASIVSLLIKHKKNNN